MDDEIKPLKIIITILTLLMIISVPIIMVFAIWNFDFDYMKKRLISMITFSNNSNNYNFDIPEGEDELLTNSIIEKGENVNIIYKTNPAQTLLINSAEIEGNIVYGTDGENLLREGFWHHPGTVYPGDNGCSVIFGHRRYHMPPQKNTFYNLDKIDIDDRVEIMLNDGTWLEYKVTNIEIISPSQLDSIVTSDYDDYLLKLITCHPLGTSKKRLVVTALRVI